MIDISDGLGSEVHHICEQSKVGAEIEAAKIQLHEDVKAAGRVLNIDPIDFAICGGEDFELLFSIAPDQIGQLEKTGMVFHPVGKITKKQNRPELIQTDGARIPLPGGYAHFIS